MAKDSSKGTGGGGGNAVAKKFEELPESLVPTGKVTKRAEEVFSREYAALRILAQDAINSNNFNVSGYSSLHRDDNEAVFSKQMLHGLESKIQSEWKDLKYDEKFGILNAEKLLQHRYALTMFQKMVNKYYKGMYLED